MQDNFDNYQQRRLGWLLGWGCLSMLVGGLLQVSTRAFWKQCGWQFVVWGLIDAVLASVGIGSARRNERLLEQGQRSDEQVQKEVRVFYRVVLVNALLDASYVLGGAWLIARFKEREERRGLGLGILIQGAWLLLFDGFLTEEVKRRWLR